MKKYFEDLIQEFSLFGSLPFFVFTGLIFLAIGKLQSFYELLVAGILLYVAVAAIRAIYFKERPNKAVYGNFLGKIDASAFPSLHSARISFLAMYAYLNFSNVYVTLLFGVAALFVFYSRIATKRHHISDVAGGAVLGILITFLVNQLM